MSTSPATIVKGTTATTTATVNVGPEQMRRTVPVGSTVRVVTVTADGRLAYVNHHGSCGYIALSDLAV